MRPPLQPPKQIEIVPYQPCWPEEYRRLVSVLRNAVQAGAAFHHIGSTAVPGLAAKDIIDIQITVSSLEKLDADALAVIGYTEHFGLSDHPPSGIELLPTELAKRFFSRAERAANVHVRVAGRFNQRYALLCRDYLRCHSTTTAAYEAVKRRLSEWFPNDLDPYYDVKDPVCDIIMDAAETWARIIGWNIPAEDT